MIRHGTNSGYTSHRRRGEAACESCKEARRVYTAELSRRRLYGDTTRKRWGEVSGTPRKTQFTTPAATLATDDADRAWRRRARHHAYGVGG